jgi:hypothetical protein
MAILRGFPPSNTISPSVRITERDLSYPAPNQSFHRAGLVGFASKGPINAPTLISTTQQLATIFGQPHPEANTDPYMIYAAQQYLLVANELYVVRVADTDTADTASVDIPASGALIDVMGDVVIEAGDLSIGSGTVNAWFQKNYNFRWRLNGVLASKTVVLDAAQPYGIADYTATGSTITTIAAGRVVAALNAQLSAEDGIEFYTASDLSGTIGVKTTFAAGPEASLEFVSCKDALVDRLGIAKGNTAAVIQSEILVDPISNLDGVLKVVVEGTDSIDIDGVVQTFTLTGTYTGGTFVQDLVDDLNAQAPVGFSFSESADKVVLTTDHKGRDAKIRVKATVGGAQIGLFQQVVSGTSDSGNDGDANEVDLGIVYGTSSNPPVAFTVTADSPGIEGNNTEIVVTNNDRDNNFSIQVFSYGNPVESWGKLSKDPDDVRYAPSYLALVSDYIKIVDNLDTTILPAPGTYTLGIENTAGFDYVEGKDGYPLDPDAVDDVVIGNPADATGIYTLSEPEQVDIDLIAVPGHSSTTVVLALLEFCEDYRQDCLAIIDPPFGMSPNEIVAWQNGLHEDNSTKFDSDFGALYWPWVKVRDNFNQIDVWVPPSGSAMSVIAQSDTLGAPWFAPAGATRGVVPGILDVYTRPTLAERDLMYGYRNCINPIVQFVDSAGFVVWGQKTLQRAPSALDRINVRRMMFYVEKRIRAASRSLLFEPNDDVFRNRFADIASSILREVLIGRGITNFIIKADAELNTADVIDRNEFRAQIGIQPTRAAEFIFIEFSLHRTGSFNENTSTF